MKIKNGIYLSNDGEPMFLSAFSYFGLSMNQKCAILHFFSVIGERSVEPPMKMSPYKLEFTACMYSFFEISSEQYRAYIMLEGEDRVVNDLIMLERNNKHALLFTITEFIKPNDVYLDRELQSVFNWLILIGIMKQDLRGPFIKEFFKSIQK